jgi:hypothetical protein
MGFKGSRGPDKEVLNVTNLLAGTVKYLDLPVLLMDFLKLSARKGAVGVLPGMEADVVSHVVVFVDGLKYFHKVKLLECVQSPS